MLSGFRSRHDNLRSAWLILCAAALLLRLAVPAGWMPVFDANGTRLVVCDGMGAMPAVAPGTSAAQHGHRMPGHAPADPTSSHPCAFAGLGLAFAFAPPDGPLILPHVPSAAPAQRRASIAVGRGLAAPPPPATGPPTFA